MHFAEWHFNGVTGALTIPLAFFLIGAWMVEHRTRVKRLGILFGSAMRLQVLFLALAALLLSREQALVVVWLVIGVWGFTSGLQMVTFSFIISKTIPAHRRGRV